MGSMITFPANGATASGYLALSPGGGGPGLIVIQEWWGLVDNIKDLCDRFAAEGYVALAPDHYHGKQTRSPDEAGKMFMALNIAQAGKEMRDAAEFLHSHPAVSPKRVGVLGFCMGGQLALYAAQEHADRLSCAVDFYGVHPQVPIEPERIRVPVLGHFGLHDTSVPVEGVKALAAKIAAAGGSLEAQFYDAGHAFFNDDRPDVFRQDAANDAWRRTLAHFGRHLRGMPAACTPSCTPSRPRDEYFLKLAMLASERATCPRMHCGCVLVKDRFVLSTGYNGSLPGQPHCEDVGCLIVDNHCVRTNHAEINALVQATTHGINIKGATAYITNMSCTTCAKALIAAGIKRVVVFSDYHDTLATKFFNDAGVEIAKVAMPDKLALSTILRIILLRRKQKNLSSKT